MTAIALVNWPSLRQGSQEGDVTGLRDTFLPTQAGENCERISVVLFQQIADLMNKEIRLQRMESRVLIEGAIAILPLDFPPTMRP